MVDGVQLLLPEVPSKLNFEQIEGFASENDTTAQVRQEPSTGLKASPVHRPALLTNSRGSCLQTELRNTRFWGRLYVDGWPQPVQYFMSHFSGPPDLHERPLLLADPPLACDKLNNAEEIRYATHGVRLLFTLSWSLIVSLCFPRRNKSAVVMVRRGECTFGTKARRAVEAGASTVIYINDREGLQHASGPDAHDLDICAVMISQVEGDLLWSEIERTSKVCGGGRSPVAR